MNPQTITFQPRRRESKSPITVAVDALCYIIMQRNYAEVILKCGHGIGITPKQKDRPARLLLMNDLESYSVLLTALERSAVRFGLRREPQKDSCVSSARKMQFSLGWNRVGAQTPASISSSRLQDRNFTGTVYNCALYSKGFGTLRLSCRS